MEELFRSYCVPCHWPGCIIALSGTVAMQLLARISVLVLLLNSGAAAQPFQDLSTTADGSVLYFSSPIRQKGTDQRFYSKIFQWTAATGVQVIAEVRNPGPSDGCASPDYYDLHAPPGQRRRKRAGLHGQPAGGAQPLLPAK